ncbi:Alpha/beta fold hydrolase [Candidatus Magnetomoraceae bacterium gMMP-15]
MIKYDYTKLDSPDVLQFMFYPRKDMGFSVLPNAIDYDINVENDIKIGARFHIINKSEPNILFFHGNGEIVSDYEDVGPLYNQYGFNFLAVDYRGYGRSNGIPTATSMMNDCHVIFKDVQTWLENHEHTGPLFVMGRSLGSASAIEIARNYSSDIKGLIIESGFASTVDLLKRIGVPVDSLGITNDDGFRNAEKIFNITKPTIMIHGQYDQIIPISDAEVLQYECTARAKQFHMVPGADHNNIMIKAGRIYFELIKAFSDKTLGKRPRRYKHKKR